MPSRSAAATARAKDAADFDRVPEPSNALRAKSSTLAKERFRYGILPLNLYQPTQHPRRREVIARLTVRGTD